MTKPKLQFKEHHKHQGRTFYPCPNEDLNKWRNLIGNRTFARTAGIASGGEVGLFVLLPHTRKGGDVVLIDHTMASLRCAMSKVALIQALGGKKVHELITADSATQLKRELNKIVDVLPPIKPEERRAYYHAGQHWWQDCYDEHPRELRKFWRKYISVNDVVAIEKRLDQIRFVHGDLRDLPEYGQFGCLYLSNALQHTTRYSRDEWGSTLEHNARLLQARTKSGMILLSGNIGRRDHQCFGKPKVSETETEASMYGWQYNMFQGRAA